MGAVRRHELPATPATVHWGTFSAEREPVLTVASGDTVFIQTISGPPEAIPSPEAGFAVPAALADYLASVPPRLGPHMLTGPVGVAGAEPGDMLEVGIDAIALAADWGYCGYRPLAGTLPDDFPERALSHIAIDRSAGTCRLPFALPGDATLPLAPFFGVMGVAPRPAYGTLSTKEPRAHGGNLDNKELVAGTRLFLPVFVEGARFSAGDGHGVQGDGEVCINALETCLDGTFTLTLHKGGGAGDPALRYPRAETPTHFISMGMHEDLDVAMRTALREMIGFLCARGGITAGEAYQLCSLAVDFHVTQTVNGEKGVHGMVRRTLLEA